jgi:predicted dienelactone hydrolase
MRLLEIALVVLVALSAFVAFNRRTPRRLLLWLCFADLLMLVAHAIVEGPHWQMAPAYLAALLFPALLAVRPMLLRRTMAALMLVLLLGACTASAILPMFRLPAPTGPYLIGTRIFHLVNDHPSDPSSAGPDGKRQLMIQVWYPASPSHAPRAPYRKLAETTLMSSYQAVLWTHSRWNAPLAQHGAPFPLLLLNPAWNGRRTYYMYLVEDLVSHGYIVAGIDHTGNSGPTAFPDGHVGQPDPDPGLDFGTHTFAELSAYGAKQQEVQVNDNRFVLDQLQGWNQDEASPFYRRIDMNRVGALGHSVGGSVAAQACLEDNRIKSALDMDGSFWGPVQATGLNKPFMMIEEDIQEPTPQQMQQDHVALVDHLLDTGDLAVMKKSNAIRITLHGSTHSSYTDRSLFSPLRRYSDFGAIPVAREYLIIRSYVLAFFNKTLRGENPALLDGTDQSFPEATVEFLHKP